MIRYWNTLARFRINIWDQRKFDPKNTVEKHHIFILCWKLYGHVLNILVVMSSSIILVIEKTIVVEISVVGSCFVKSFILIFVLFSLNKTHFWDFFPWIKFASILIVNPDKSNRWYTRAKLCYVTGVSRYLSVAVIFTQN